MNQRVISYHGYEPGALATLCAMQAIYYADLLNFGNAYEARVASDIGAFLARFNPAQDLVVIARSGTEIVGGIVIDHGPSDPEYARLRWYIVSASVRGQGVGRTLISKAMDFIREQQIQCVYLTTIDGLDAARHLYDLAGFKLTHEECGDTWGPRVTEQRMEYTKPQSP